MKRYDPPNKGKIKYYKDIIKNGHVVVAFQAYKGCTFFGKIWENEFGGGVALNKLLPFDIGRTGHWVVTSEEYLNYCTQSVIGKKANLLKERHGYPAGTVVKMLSVKNTVIKCQIKTADRLPFQYIEGVDNLNLSAFQTIEK